MYQALKHLFKNQRHIKTLPLRFIFFYVYSTANIFLNYTEMKKDDNRKCFQNVFSMKKNHTLPSHPGVVLQFLIFIRKSLYFIHTDDCFILLFFFLLIRANITLNLTKRIGIIYANRTMTFK